MAAKSLRCVVIAYKKCEMDKVLKDEKHMAEWVLPEDDLVWNAYVGIKDPCRLGVKDEVKLCSDASVKNQDSEFNLAVFNQNVTQTLPEQPLVEIQHEKEEEERVMVEEGRSFCYSCSRIKSVCFDF
ncbi:calcium-transporting ATPase 10, plasma membrane-type [Daucus carota subsp. sativus]|uniref:calcium-transporting ATPase 10, plasma membrane-type n=1 Tax=Daucus carota subsp. sativus TaxID=79200 RepID=UPI0007EFC8CC|nr:PREDICTED: calcium-transporting ATPase 10, plasma membrane-type-like [Daucus carota subsp. sativus]XP_017255869.1 PREDICTED: calcium-transporting ATPase 10, plasma membrane-type-like [Daucus carota subsp. sativus]XP_017255870.1 PREDICTED: calcium-transporting ATPase 10, plasma membrane-type-like [Daucus carota subsp. sativus]XP_017255871.1 PREDICTED: calcium-transporting ATPase 10, plasma membrane-type-like [Daucus carota subsp. sativus]